MKRPDFFKRWLYAHMYGAKLPWWKLIVVRLYIRIAL